jgi:hypothetical protein
MHPYALSLQEHLKVGQRAIAIGRSANGIETALHIERPGTCRCIKRIQPDCVSRPLSGYFLYLFYAKASNSAPLKLRGDRHGEQIEWTCAGRESAEVNFSQD